jgi:hypothetical protein
MRPVMASVFACCVALFLAFSVNAQSTDSAVGTSSRPLRVLFIGNSYTYYNGMPNMLASMVPSSGRLRIETRAETIGGATLERLAALRSTRFALLDGPWDFVVLQEQSMLPIISPEKMFRAARELDAEVRKVNAKTLLYLTWARRSEAAKQATLDHAYGTLGKELGALVAPVGPAWQAALIASPDLALYVNDGSHPTPLGSFLAACVIYLTMLPGESQCPVLAGRGIGAADMQVAREAAERVTRPR